MSLEDFRRRFQRPAALEQIVKRISLGKYMRPVFYTAEAENSEAVKLLRIWFKGP